MSTKFIDSEFQSLKAIFVLFFFPFCGPPAAPATQFQSCHFAFGAELKEPPWLASLLPASLITTTLAFFSLWPWALVFFAVLFLNGERLTHLPSRRGPSFLLDLL